MSAFDEAFRKSMTDEEYKKFTAFDREDPYVKRFIEKVHDILQALNEEITYDDDRISVANRIFMILADEPDLLLQKCATLFTKKYKTQMTENGVRDALEDVGLINNDIRLEIFKWSEDAVRKFEEALRNPDSANCKLCLKCFMVKRDHRRRDEMKRNKIKRRIFCIMLFKKHPELISKDNLRLLENFGNKYTKPLSHGILDALTDICGVNKDDDLYKALQEETETLKNSLKRNEIEFDSLKNDFEEQLQERLQDERINFFASLNSEKYGCILDEIINALNGKNKLRKQKIELPLEINGLFVLIDKIAKFVRDNEINPIMKTGAILDMTVGEIEAWNADYNGNTHFTSADERKRVKVISPGWFYKEKDIQISRPKLLEYTDEDEQ